MSEERKTITLEGDWRRALVAAAVPPERHLRLNQRFILALNVEHGRLKGWLRSPAEAVEELFEVEAADFFKSNLQLAGGNPLLALGEGSEE